MVVLFGDNNRSDDVCFSFDWWPKAREALVSVLGTLDEVDRVGLVSDAFATSAAGFASTTDALDLLPAYKVRIFLYYEAVVRATLDLN
eukprot:1181734-Prorocentrum_minimum.AAC.1